MSKKLIHTSATGTRTRVAQVQAEYPNQLDYSGTQWYHADGPPVCYKKNVLLILNLVHIHATPYP